MDKVIIGKVIFPKVSKKVLKFTEQEYFGICHFLPLPPGLSQMYQNSFDVHGTVNR